MGRLSRSGSGGEAVGGEAKPASSGRLTRLAGLPVCSASCRRCPLAEAPLLSGLTRFCKVLYVQQTFRRSRSMGISKAHQNASICLLLIAFGCVVQEQVAEPTPQPSLTEGLLQAGELKERQSLASACKGIIRDAATRRVRDCTWQVMAPARQARPVACCMWRARPLAVGNAANKRTSTPSCAATCSRALHAVARKGPRDNPDRVSAAGAACIIDTGFHAIPALQ